LHDIRRAVYIIHRSPGEQGLRCDFLEKSLAGKRVRFSHSLIPLVPCLVEAVNVGHNEPLSNGCPSINSKELAMWCSLAVAAVLAAAHAQTGLQITNTRLTIGELGGTRPNAQVLPGDILFIAFDIDGVTIDPLGAVRYTMSLEVTNALGKQVLKQDPREIAEFAPLRGSKIPARAFVTVGADQDPGNFSCKITVTDLSNKSSATILQKFDVLKKDFGIVGVNTFYDEERRIPAPTSGFVGQLIVVNFVIVGFTRDPKTKQPIVEIEFQALDDKNQPTMPEPLKDKVDSGIKEEDSGFVRQFPLFMNRPGKFSVKIKATDRVGNRVFTYDLPVTIYPAP